MEQGAEFYHHELMGQHESDIELIRQCNEGVFRARKDFQERFGAMIYNYSRALLHSDKMESGDFYLYAFDKDRIFKRLRSFRGDNITLVNYLRYFVLRDLCLEWLRSNSRRSLDTIPYEDTEQFSLDDREMSDDQDRAEWVRQLIDRPEFFVLKLLYLEEYELGVEDIRFLAQVSGRSIGDTILLIDTTRDTLVRRNAAKQCIYEKLDRIFVISLSYQKRIAELEFEMKNLDSGLNSEEVKRLSAEKAENERRLEWRGSQREKLLRQLPKSIAATPYQDLARLLNWPLGTVSSKVARARRAFQSAYETFHKLG